MDFLYSRDSLKTDFLIKMDLNKSFKKSWNPAVFRIFSLVVFLIFLAGLYFGTIKIFLNLNLTRRWVLFVLWMLWWPFLYISLLFVGRVWCGFLCPARIAADFGNKLNKSKKDPLMKYSFFSFVLFFFIAFWEQVSGLFGSPRLTFLFLFSFFVSAFLIGIFIPRAGFCRHFCPIGAIFKPFGRLSFFGLRTDKKKCSECKTKDCIRGGKYPPCPVYLNVPTLQSNSECLLCVNCIKNCPYNSAKIRFLWPPGRELKNKIGFNLSESLFIIALLGFSTILTTKGTELVRFFDASGTLLRAFDFIISIFLMMAFFFFLTLIHGIFNKESSFKKNLIDGGYSFLPLTFSIMFILIVFGFLLSLSSLSFEAIAGIKYAVLIFGGVWSMRLSKSFFKRPIVYALGIVLILLLWIFILIPGPLNGLIFKNSGSYFISDGEVVQMESFSMGYNPSTLIAEKGSSFKLNITNLDIHHSFELEEFGISENFLGKESKVIEINASKKGKYEFYCALPGHKEAGMKGVLIIK